MMFFLLFALLLSTLAICTLEKKTARRYLVADGFLFGLSLVLTTLLNPASTELFRSFVSGLFLYSLITGLFLLFQIYVNHPVESRE